jgi:hypothetical protein
MKKWLITASAVVGLTLPGRTGLRVWPVAFPAFGGRAPEPDRVPLPPGLPALVAPESNCHTIAPSSCDKQPFP